MVFLPCPKFQRGGHRSSDTEDSPAADGITERDVPEPTSQLSVDDSERDREALAGIFAQPTPQSSRNRIRIPFRSRSLASRYPSIARTKSRVSMTSISSKLRRRFSKDANLAKKPSRVTIAGTQEVFDESEGGSNAGYDSDAHCILTPQITEAVNGSPYSVAKRREPHDKQAQRTSTLLSGVIDAEQAPECASIAGARTPLPKDPDSSCTDKNSTSVRSRKETNTATGTPRACEKKTDNGVYGTPAGSCLESFFTPPDGRSPADDGRTNNPHEGLDIASPKLQQSATRAPAFHRLYPVPERPPPPIPCRHPARRASVQGTPDSRTKLLYSERPPSFNISRPEPRQSPQVNQGSAVIRRNDVSESAGAIEPTASNGAGPFKTEVNSDQSDGGLQGQAKSPKHPRAPVPKGFAGGPQTDSLDKLHVAKRNSIAVRQSRFREDFEVSYTEEVAPKNLTRSKSTREQHRSSSEGWLSEGRRLGYGYNFVPGSGSPAKRATQGQQKAADNKQQEDDRTPVEGPVHAEANSKKPLNPAAETNEETNTAPLTALPDCPVDTTDTNIKATQVKRSFSLRSWARFPRSGKKESSFAAVHDATVPDTEVTATETETPKTTPKGPRGKGLFRNLSLARGKSILKRRESVPSELIELGRTARGEGPSNSSVHEQPTEGAGGATGSRDASLGHVLGSSTYSPLLRPGGYDGPLDHRLHPLSSLDRSSENQDPAASATDMRTAESWSQLYQDCLPELTVSGETEALAAAERERSVTEEREADAGKKRVASALASSTAMHAAIGSHKEPNRVIQGTAREGLR